MVQNSISNLAGHFQLGGDLDTLHFDKCPPGSQDPLLAKL